ncbi:MAG TPA: diguanylate cyclase [Myxococcales bacterium]
MDAKLSVLLVESNLAVASPVRAQLERAGYQVELAYSPEAALTRARASKVDAALLGVSGLDGESLAPRLHKIDPDMPICLLSPADDDALDWRAEAAGADASLSGTLAGANLDSAVRSLVKIGALRRRVSGRGGVPPPAPRPSSVEIEILPESVVAVAEPKAAAPKPIQGASAGGFDFFRRLLLVEVHRSRRYRYPLAFLLASMDGWKERAATLAPMEQASFMGKVLRAVVKSVRDVDLCALYGTDRFVVFMPHTGHDGARLVANRLRERIAAVEGELTDMTASLGLACYDGQGQISYGALLREATLSLRQAQSEGGNRIVVSERDAKDAKVAKDGKAKSKSAGKAKKKSA